MTYSFMVATISSTGVLPLKRWLIRVTGKLVSRGLEEARDYMPIQKINVICLQPLKAFGNSHVDILAIVADLASTVRRHMVAELCREEYLEGHALVHQYIISSVSHGDNYPEQVHTSPRLPVR